MNETLETLKTKAKQYAPEILCVIGATTGIAALVLAARLPNVKLPLNFELELGKTAIDHMIETGQDLAFDTPKLKLLVKLIPDK